MRRTRAALSAASDSAAAPSASRAGVVSAALRNAPPQTGAFSLSRLAQSSWVRGSRDQARTAADLSAVLADALEPRMMLAGTAIDAGAISGFVYNDLNENGIFDAGTDVAIEGANVFVDENENLIFDAGTENCFATTDANGNFLIAAVDPGVVSLRIDLAGLDADPNLGFDGVLLTEPDGTPEGNEDPLPANTERTAAGYLVTVLPNREIGGIRFGVADAGGEEVPPIVSDRSFTVIEFNEQRELDSPGFYPSPYIVGSVAGFNPNTGDPSGLYYQIVNGNIGDEEKPFGIIADDADAAVFVDGQVADFVAREGLDPNDPNDQPAIQAERTRVEGLVEPGTVFVNNPFLLDLRTKIAGDEFPDGVFNLQVLVATDNPNEGIQLDGDPQEEGLGVDGAFDIIDVDLEIVPFNRIQEQELNDSVARSQDINDGGQTHGRLGFDFDLDRDFMNNSILGDPENLQFGARRDQWAFIDGEIAERGDDADGNPLPADIDIFRIDLSERTGLFLDVDAAELGSTLDAQVSILDINGNVVTGDSFRQFNPSGSAVNNDGYDFEFYAAPGGDGVLDDRSPDPSLYADLDAGTYFIRIQGVGTEDPALGVAGSAATGTYTLRMLGDRSYASLGSQELTDFFARYETTDINNDGQLPDGSLNTRIGADYGVDPLDDDFDDSTLDFDGDGEIDDNEVEIAGTGSERQFTVPEFVVYLDFDGQVGVDRPVAFGGGAGADLDAFDFSGDQGEFTPGEMLAIQNIWRIVREDFSSFNVNVTTDESVYNDAVAAGDGTYRVVFTQSTLEEFINDPQFGDIDPQRILETGDSDPASGDNDGTGIVFASALLSYSGDSAYPVSGRIVATSIEAGNYASNVFGLSPILGLDNYTAQQNNTSTVYPDAIMAEGDQGLNREYWRDGVTNNRVLQADLPQLQQVLGYREADNSSDIFGRDVDGQLSTNRMANGLPAEESGLGGETSANGNDQNLVFTTLDGTLDPSVNPDLVRFNDSRAGETVFGKTAVLNDVFYDPRINTFQHWTDYDVFLLPVPLDDWRVYVDVDEYSSNTDLHVDIFQVNTMTGAIVNRQEISFDGADTQTAADRADIDAGDRRNWEFDGINVTEVDAFLDKSDYTDYDVRFPVFINVTSEDRLIDIRDITQTRLGIYDVRFVRSTPIVNQQPDGPDQTVDIRIDENVVVPASDPDNATGEDKNTIYDYYRIGRVNLGRGIAPFPNDPYIFEGDPQNPDDDGRTGQTWIFEVQGEQVFDDDGNVSLINTEPGDLPFMIDSGTGDIYVTDPSRIDFELQSEYQLLVHATDNGFPERFAPVIVNIRLNDLNERPTAENPQVLPSVAESPASVTGTVVGQVVVTDPDDADGIPPFESFVYTINSITRNLRDGSSETLSTNAFTIDSLGRIIVEDPSVLDFEEVITSDLAADPDNPTPAEYSFVINVTATEDRADPFSTEPFDVVFDLRNVEERPFFDSDADGEKDTGRRTPLPFFDPDGDGNPDPVKIDESSPIGTVLVDSSEIRPFTFNEDNIAPGLPTPAGYVPQDVTYSLSGGNGAFVIDAQTGEITVANPRLLDFEDPTANMYTLVVTATDTGPLSLATDLVFDVMVNDISPEPPQFDLPITFRIDENPEPGQIIGPINVTDENGNQIPDNRIELLGTAARLLKVENGMLRILTDADPEEVNPGNGFSEAAGFFNTEALPEGSTPFTGVFEFRVRATDPSDSSLTTDQNYTIRVDNVQEDPPTAPPVQNFSVVENSPPGTKLTDASGNPTGQVIATIPPELARYGVFGRVNYRIVAGNEDGAFRIAPATGMLTVANGEAIDFESNEMRTLTIEAFGTYDNKVIPGEVDGDGDPDEDVVTITANITIINENEPPDIQDDEFTIDENSAVGFVVATLNAPDPDQTMDVVTLEITGGNTGGAFRLEPVNDAGVARLIVNNSRVLDFERMPVFELEITASDDKGASQTATITINLRDLVEAEDIVQRNVDTGAIFVARSTGTDFIHEQWGLYTTSVGFQHFMTGDFNGDGLTDIVSQTSTGGTWFVGTSDGTQFVSRRWGRQFPNDEAYDSHMVLDVNGDGRDDLVFREIATGSFLAGISNGQTFNYVDFGGNWNTSVDWRFRGGDFNGDGLEDILGQADSNGKLFVALSDGTQFTRSQWQPTGRPLGASGFPAGPGRSAHARYETFTVGDFNADGLTDVLGLDKNTGNIVVALANPDAGGNGGTFDLSAWGGLNLAPGVFDNFRIGDFNGDGASDYAIQRQSSGRWLVGISDQVGSFQTRVRFDTRTDLEDIVVADVTADGRDDIIGRRFDGTWLVAIASADRLWTTALWSASPGEPDAEYQFVRTGGFDPNLPADPGGMSMTAAWQDTLPPPAPAATPAAVTLDSSTSDWTPAPARMVADEAESLDALFAAIDDDELDELI